MYPVNDGIPALLPEQYNLEMESFYDDLADTGGNSSEVTSYRFPRQQRNMVSAVAKVLAALQCKPSTILDVGCGVGVFTKDYCAESAVFGVDLSLGLLRRAQAEGLCAIQSDGTNLPFEDGQFDVVVCPEIIQIFDDPSPLLSEICRTCKPGGYVIITTLYRKSLVRAAYRTLGCFSKDIHDRQKVSIRRNHKDIEELATGLPLEVRLRSWTHFPIDYVLLKTPPAQHFFPLAASNIISVFQKTK